jgi:Immunity protein 26
MARRRLRAGDVFQIPLPDGRYAYGRLYDDASVGIYRLITESPLHPPIGSRDFLFTVGLYRDILENGRWEIIGRDPFAPDESRWPPPYFVRDLISGQYQIYHRGLFRPAEFGDIEGLEEAAVYDSDHIVDRILTDIANR